MKGHAINYEQEREWLLDDLAERIAGCRDELVALEAQLRRVAAWQPDEFDPDPSSVRRPGMDLRLYESAGSDVAESYRPVDAVVPRSMLDVPVGDRL